MRTIFFSAAVKLNVWSSFDLQASSKSDCTSAVPREFWLLWAVALACVVLVDSLVHILHFIPVSRSLRVSRPPSSVVTYEVLRLLMTRLVTEYLKLKMCRATLCVVRVGHDMRTDSASGGRVEGAAARAGVPPLM